MIKIIKYPLQAAAISGFEIFFLKKHSCTFKCSRAPNRCSSQFDHYVATTYVNKLIRIQGLCINRKHKLKKGLVACWL